MCCHLYVKSHCVKCAYFQVSVHVMNRTYVLILPALVVSSLPHKKLAAWNQALKRVACNCDFKYMGRAILTAFTQEVTESLLSVCKS